jgi:uncharacterized protein YndB with AHSA1/START domain
MRMSGDLRFSHTTVIDAPRRRVWDALTLPEERNKYVCTENQADLRAGGAFIEVFQYGPARAGVFLVVDRPNRLVQENFVFDRGTSHRYFNAFTLSNSFGGTALTIDVEGFSRNDSEDWLRESMYVGWKTELQVLKAYVETGEDIRPEVWKGVLMGLRFVSSDTPPGVRIIDVIANTPAAAAGLRVADVVQGVDGTKVADFLEFREQISRFSPGDAACFQVTREGGTADYPIVFGNAIG